MRIAIAGLLAGAALLAPAAQAQELVQVCTSENPCWDCVMYPCHPDEYVPYAVDRAVGLCQATFSFCAK